MLPASLTKSFLFWSKRITDGPILPLLGLAVFAALAIGKIVSAENFSVLVWGDRDLWRGLEYFAQPDARGPENNAGFRPPGGFFYHLLNIVFRFSATVPAANIALGFMLVLSVLLISALLWKSLSPRAGVIGGMSLFSNGLLLQTYGVWNPGFILFFGTLATCALLLFARNRNPIYLGASILAIALGMQIHMQITVFLLAVPIVMFAYKIRPTFACIIAVLGAFILAYLPSVIIDPSSLGVIFQNNQISFLSQYSTSRGLFERGVPEAVKMFFSASGGSAAILATSLRPRYEIVLGCLWLADAVAVFAALFAPVAIIRKQKKLLMPSDRGIGVALILVVTYIATFTFGNVNFRHFTTLIPAVSILVAVGIEDIIKRLNTGTPKVWTSAASLLLIAFISGRAATVAGINFSHANIAPRSYLAQREIADHVKAHYYSDHSDFESYASYFLRENGSWRMETPDLGNRMATVFRLSPSFPISESAARCLAIAPKWLVDRTSAEVLASELGQLPALKERAAAFSERSESLNFFYFTYTTPDQNCLKSFPNPYIATSFEQRFLLPHPPTDKTTVTAIDIASNRAAYVIRWPGFPFPWAIEIQGVNNTLTATVHGRILRGHTGLPTESLENTKLSFEGNSDIFELPFSSEVIGDISAGTLTPWKSFPIAASAGVYLVRLSATSRTQGDIALDLGPLALGADGSVSTQPQN